MLQLTCTIGTYITGVIAVAAVIGLIVAIFEIHKSIKISCLLAETSVIMDFNKWTSEYHRSPTFNHAARVLNVSEIMVKGVNSGIYPYEAYKSSFLPVTFQYFYNLERAWYNEDKGTTEEFKTASAKFAKVLWPVFKIYDRRVEENVGTCNRTYAGLEGFDPSEIDLTKSESKSLKYEIKYS
jgi:hypothetical protein